MLFSEIKEFCDGKEIQNFWSNQKLLTDLREMTVKTDSFEKDNKYFRHLKDQKADFI